MLSKFRKNHILQFFLEWNQAAYIPLDKSLNHYLRNHSAIGSKDRKIISDSIYGIIKWKSLLDAHLQNLGKNLTDENRLDLWTATTIEELKKANFLNAHEQYGFPKTLFERLKTSLGETKALELCKVTQTRAPIVVRVNTKKTSRQALFHGWKDRYDVSLCETSEMGILFHEKLNFFQLPEFAKGLFEVQDEGSQLIASLVDAKPGQEVLDFCAGAGGKTLSFAPKMLGKGQIFLYDPRAKALMNAKKRLRRCGIQNAQIITEQKSLKRLKSRMDWILLDVPCSGSGTWRRKPDQKWRYTDKTLENLIEEQKTIFKQALAYLAPGGRIVYSTCSVFPEENEKQVDFFCNTYGATVVGTPLQIFPEEGKMDGFYGAIISLDKISSHKDNPQHV